jgi:hypothetical protein
LRQIGRVNLVTADVEITAPETTPSAAEEATSSDERDLSIQPDAQETPEEKSPTAQDAPETEEPEPTGPEKGTPEYGAYLQAKLDADEVPLTTEEKADLRSHQQSQRDQERARTQARDEARRNEQRIRELATGLEARLLTAVTNEMTAAKEEERPPSPSLLKAAFSGEIAAIRDELNPIVLAPYTSAFRGKIAELAGREAADELEGASFLDVANAYISAAYEQGKSDAPDAKKSATLQKEVDSLKGQIKTLDAQLKEKGGGPSTNGRDHSGGGSSWNNKREARNLHVQGKLSDAEMRRIRADPNIPEGY